MTKMDPTAKGVLMTVGGIVGAGVVMIVITSLMGHASQADLDSIEAESKGRDAVITEVMKDHLGVYREEVKQQIRFRTLVGVKLDLDMGDNE